MRIIGLEIEKFRSIQRCKIELGEINAIVGENNAGKTAILRALNSVFNYEYEEKYFLDQTHKYGPRSNTKIKVYIHDVPDEKYVNNISEGLIKLLFTYNYNTHKRNLYTIDDDDNPILVNEDFMSKLKKDIDYVYIPASRGNRDLSWTDNSIFKRLISVFTSKYTQNRDTISCRVKSVANVLQNNILSKIANQISALNMQNENIDYTLEYEGDIDYTIFLNKLGIAVSDSGKVFPIKECGSGIKSITVIALHRALAQIENTNIILGIEEPETNLHPQAQKKLVSSLKNHREQYEVQTIFATHSTVIIDALNHEDIVLVRRVEDSNRGFKSKISQLSKDFWEKYDIEDFQHYSFFKYRNSDFFFAKYVVLVESPTDAQVIEKMIKPALGNKLYGVSILNLNGVENLKYPYFLLKDLEIPFSMVVDKDFFVPYSNGSLDQSRNQDTWLPEYATQINSNCVIDDIFKTNTLKQELQNRLQESYSKLFDFIKKYKIYPMQFCLEMDLACSEKACEKYYDLLNMLPNSHNQKSLLKDKKKAIKKAEYILKILDEINVKSYPTSYKKIKNALISDISEKIID